MKDFFGKIFKNKKSSVLFAVVAVIIAALVIHTFFASGVIGEGGESKAAVTTASKINPRAGEPSASTADSAESTECTAASSENKQAATATTASSTSATAGTTQPQTVPFATAIPPQYPADYSAQWNAGYLVAIDNPDTTYACPHVELSDEDRDLLERLCMGEFGSGGFIGAALIAQAVKDAMCFDGYTNVADVIKYCHYDGSTEIGTNDACRQAVRYVFDDNGEAVQHRIMYMYNPYMVQSSFHESQNFILSYQGVRFFDRWGY